MGAVRCSIRRCVRRRRVWLLRSHTALFASRTRYAIAADGQRIIYVWSTYLIKKEKIWKDGKFWPGTFYPSFVHFIHKRYISSTITIVSYQKMLAHVSTLAPGTFYCHLTIAYISTYMSKDEVREVGRILNVFINVDVYVIFYMVMLSLRNTKGTK